ncbi:MAG: SWIM zinc finger family protein [Anaerolineae bacterium]|nr:SWIM zinc finger family protein [Anaerolineae bacterium]MDW8299275.1 SWIM zinc finger family protein [Anaerolineae bacterium]
MDYGMIGQIAKAKHYAEERHRLRFLAFKVSMVGDNHTHTVTYSVEHGWHCTSDFFRSHGWSSHTVALERILKDMIAPAPPAEIKEIGAQSAIISQVEKAKKYTDEPQRVRFHSFTVSFSGDNHTHTVRYEDGKWECTCNFFKSHGWCSHVIAIERILGVMVSPTVRTPEAH